MPGFSDYLYPLGENGLLLGVGKDATATGQVSGIKIALMDVADNSRPRVLASHTLGKQGSTRGLDLSSRAVNIFKQAGGYRITLPVRLVEPPAASPARIF